MAAKKMDMQRKLIEQQRDQLLREIEALQNKVAGLEMAISLLGSSESDENNKEKSRNGLKQMLADMLREVGTTGLNATSAVDIAQRRGVHLDRQSVSSTLSRMKAENVVEYDGERYRLVHFSRAAHAINLIRTSRPATN